MLGQFQGSVQSALESGTPTLLVAGCWLLVAVRHHSPHCPAFPASFPACSSSRSSPAPSREGGNLESLHHRTCRLMARPPSSPSGPSGPLPNANDSAVQPDWVPGTGLSGPFCPYYVLVQQIAATQAPPDWLPGGGSTLERVRPHLRDQPSLPWSLIPCARMRI